MHYLTGTNFRAIYLILGFFPLVCTLGFMQAMGIYYRHRDPDFDLPRERMHLIKVGIWTFALWAVYITIYLTIIRKR